MHSKLPKMSDKMTTKKRKSRRQTSNPAQSKRFIEAARAAEADDRNQALDEAFDRIKLPKTGMCQKDI